MNDLFKWIDAHSAELEETYKRLHTIPELGLQEHKTSAFLAEELRKAGYEVRDGIGGTGVMGALRGREPGPVFALRADMDALPITENTGLPYASTHPGVMHACGHDSHCAMLLYAAKSIAATGGIKRGVLKIVFQPAEEILKGARAFLASGALSDVNEIVGMHVRPKEEAQVGQASPAICYGGTTQLKAKVHGRAAHSARYHLGVNVIEAMAAIVHNLNAIHLNPMLGHSVKITQCVVPSKAMNIIPDLAEISVDLRAQTNEIMDELVKRSWKALEDGAASLGATVEIEKFGSVPAADFDPELVEAARTSIKAVLGEKSILPPVITPGSEDFCCYKVEGGIKSAFFGLGGDMSPGLHTAEARLNLSALPAGAKIAAHLAAAKLR
jgi:amidohydrolase